MDKYWFAECLRLIPVLIRGFETENSVPNIFGEETNSLFSNAFSQLNTLFSQGIHVLRKTNKSHKGHCLGFSDFTTRQFFCHQGCRNVQITKEKIITDSNVIAQAAMDGQGVALGIFPLIQNEVDAGRLIRPLDINLKPKRAYYLLTRPGAGKKAEVEIVCRWLENEPNSGCV